MALRIAGGYYPCREEERASISVLLADAVHQEIAKYDANKHTTRTLAEGNMNRRGHRKAYKRSDIHLKKTGALLRDADKDDYVLWQFDVCTLLEGPFTNRKVVAIGSTVKKRMSAGGQRSGSRLKAL